MYPVSNQFLAAIYSDSVETNLTGTIGSATFTKNNIVAGSFHISNQCTDTSDITLGSVFLGQLTCTFTDVEIAYTNWIGKDITPTLSVKVGENAWESVPLGVFRVMEAKHTAEGVMVTAYDNMRKFDRKIKKAHFKNVEANLHTFVTTICSDCHITFGMTQEEFFELPNSSETTFVFGYTNETKKYSNDIETYRDLLFYVAQTMGCFATIDRNGQLIFGKYESNVAETISDRQRLSGAQFADYITNYTGIYVTNMKDDTEDYYGYDVDLIDAEIALVNQELQELDTAMDELEQAYQAHEITEEEYLRQKKIIQRNVKQCDKRLNWLYKAKAKAQAGEEGTFMDLGANPFLQSDNNTKRERMRRRVLKALDPISYTPFICDSVMGMHYDLGDVIYFTGGHAGSDGVFCCLMAFDWTYNAEYQAQGFGVDPSILNVKQRTDKKVKEANTNALNAKELSSGMDVPLNSDGKQDDIYIKYNEKTTYTPLYPIKYEGLVTCVYNPPSQPYHFIKPDDIAKVDKDKVDWDTNAGVYDFDIKGYVYQNIWSSEQPAAGANGHIYNPYFKIIVPEERGRYKITFDASWSCPDGGYGVSIGFTDWTGYTDCGVGTAPVACSLTGGATMTHYEYVQDYLPGHDEYYIWMSMWFPFMPSASGGKAYMDMKIRNLRVERVVDPGSGTTDGGVETTVDRYIDKVYVKDEDPATMQEYWKEIEYIAGIDDSSHSGLELDYKRYLHLTPEVMRAWFKADPPQVKRTFNQFCMRYTGKPDSAINISLHSNTGWLNKSIKKDSEGVFTVKSAGIVTSENIEYCAYALTGLTSGQRYYFNLKCNFKDGTTFGNNFNKGLGLVFNTTGIIDTDDWTGNPNTFDDEHLYYSMPRRTTAFFADFSFIATASTMYMCVVVADITSGQSSSLTLSRFVISKTERDYIRTFYAFDLESNDWLQYKPWGSGDESGEGGASSLADLDDVNLDNIQNGQSLYYNATTGEWSNGDMPIASANSVGGIKVGANLSIDANGVLSATGGASDVELVELTQAEYDQLTPEEKADPNVIYFITDGGGSGGGGGGTTVIANPTGQATDTLNKLQVGSTIYEVGARGITPLDTTERTDLNTSFELSDSINNYDVLLINIYYTGGSGYPITGSGMFIVAGLSSHSYQVWIDGGSNDRALEIEFTDSTHYQIISSNGGNGVHGVYGIKY